MDERTKLAYTYWCVVLVVSLVYLTLVCCGSGLLFAAIVLIREW